MTKVLAFLKNESGATAIEYGLIAAGISVVIIAAVNSIGTTLNSKFTDISTQPKEAVAHVAGSWKPPATAASFPGAGFRDEVRQVLRSLPMTARGCSKRY